MFLFNVFFISNVADMSIFKDKILLKLYYKFAKSKGKIKKLNTCKEKIIILGLQYSCNT